MKPILSGVLFTALVFGALSGCSNTSNKSPNLTDNIRKSLDQAGLKDVSVSQDRDKGVVKLSGTVPSEGDKSRAESVAKSLAGPQVVADEVAVRPPGDESTARSTESDLDKGIKDNLHAALVSHKLNRNVNYDVKNGVVTLTGKVNSQSQRGMAEKLAKDVPNVTQVVNELEVRNQKASSSD